MARVVEISKVRREQRRRLEQDVTEQCIEVLEWNLRNSLDRYFLAPREERLDRATRIRKLSEVLEYTLRMP
jgi:hypothetical protein